MFGAKTRQGELGLQKRKGLLPIISLLGNVWKLPQGSPNFETYQGDIMWALGIQKGLSLLWVFGCSLCLRENAEHHLFQPFSLRAWSTVNNQSAWHRKLDQQWGDMVRPKNGNPTISIDQLCSIFSEPETNGLRIVQGSSASFGGSHPLTSSQELPTDWEGQHLCQCLGNNWKWSSSLISMVFDSIVMYCLCWHDFQKNINYCFFTRCHP